MNDPTLIGPCADYEHDLVELHDGALPPERAHAVRLHVGHCTRCRDWAAAFASLDARLAAVLPRPELSSDFDARLRDRLATLARPAPRGDLRGAIEREHDALIESLRRGARRNALLGAVAVAAATAAALVAAWDLLPDAAEALSALPGGAEPWVMFDTVGVAVAIAGLAWSATRNGLRWPGLVR